jgi:hypothetical protein
MKWTSEDIKFVEKAIEIKNKGYYLDGGQLTEVYNRVLEKRATPTNCGSCIRQRVSELEAALAQFKKMNEKVEEENKSEQDAINERMAKVRAAKKVKK